MRFLFLNEKAHPRFGCAFLLLLLCCFTFLIELQAL